MKTHGPIEQEWRELMNFLAKTIDEAFNGKGCKPEEKKMGFALLLFPFGSDDKNRVNYISNGERENMLTAMKEFIARAEGRHHETATMQ